MMTVLIFVRPASTSAFFEHRLYYGVALYLAELEGSLSNGLQALLPHSPSASKVT
jgi:hypothetical protein